MLGRRKQRTTYRFILLVEVIHISVQDLYKQLYRYRSIHARIGHTQSALQTFENALTIAVELSFVSCMLPVGRVGTYVRGVLFLSWNLNGPP